jgi:serum/glucocorticoid-regulated kinase 2
MFDTGREINSEQLIQKLVREGVSSTTIRFINPVARDLISKVNKLISIGTFIDRTYALECIERNPAMRIGVREIQHHPYFSNTYDLRPVGYPAYLKTSFSSEIGERLSSRKH